MDLLDKLAITVTYKKSFIDWGRNLVPDMPDHLGVFGESKTYLIKFSNQNADKILNKYWREIFEIELNGIWTNENDWPPKLTKKMFFEWFSVELSDFVIELS